ncbi:MAG: isoprenyl transferase [Proteobacteria bacterium]|nr:isoprenyl transferase [Pseudomonadota bacterium]MBU1231750.1 isoprenyl transferase [Pseudomonadota bacterium]MBU1419398.1 isoprenyl transferase [Pseudomonadota bacterium]MBU1454238.1 isoprenyl transferase [Pseudomonadota bacterium]
MVDQQPIDPARIPTHVAIIMDGNGRWAQQKHRPRLYGHKVGVESVQEIVECASEWGVKVLTLYAFSSENWKRPSVEVSGLMGLLKSYLLSELSKMLKNRVRLISIGDTQRLPRDVQEVLERTIEETAENDGLILNLALSYGGRSEIVQAVRQIASEVLAEQISLDEIGEKLITDHLYTAGLPEPDLLIRTGGEARLSNFLLWQASYAEIYFTDTMWPEFRRSAFSQAIAEYQGRERRFGRTSAQLGSG